MHAAASWFATLQEHCTDLVIGIDELDCRIAVPEAQAGEFVLSFRVRHPKL